MYLRLWPLRSAQNLQMIPEIASYFASPVSSLRTIVAAIEVRSPTLLFWCDLVTASHSSKSSFWTRRPASSRPSAEVRWKRSSSYAAISQQPKRISGESTFPAFGHHQNLDAQPSRRTQARERPTQSRTRSPWHAFAPYARPPSASRRCLRHYRQRPPTLVHRYLPRHEATRRRQRSRSTSAHSTFDARSSPDDTRSSHATASRCDSQWPSALLDFLLSATRLIERAYRVRCALNKLKLPFTKATHRQFAYDPNRTRRSDENDAPPSHHLNQYFQPPPQPGPSTAYRRSTAIIPQSFHPPSQRTPSNNFTARPSASRSQFRPAAMPMPSTSSAVRAKPLSTSNKLGAPNGGFRAASSLGHR